MRVPGISFQMGVRGLIRVNLGLLDMKRFENHCFNRSWLLTSLAKPGDTDCVYAVGVYRIDNGITSNLHYMCALQNVPK